MIELRGVGKDYGSIAIGPMTFTVESGSIVGLLGPNGSGKTTTLCRMVGLLHGSGETLFDGSHYSDARIPQQVVGIMFDGVPAHPARSVINHLKLAATVADASISRCYELLETVGLASVSRRRIDKLSLGMRQRLGIACALIGSPRYLILDEPGIGLDPAGTVWLRDLLQSMAAAGCAILLSTHDLTMVESIADRVILISNGALQCDYTMKDFVARDVGHIVEVTCRLPSKAAEALASAGIGQCDSVLHSTVTIWDATIEDVCRCLAVANVGILLIRYASGRLEEVYASRMDELNDEA